MIVFCCCFASIAIAADTWVEDKFEDFADGRLDAAGQNIYVAKDGTVRTIHRFDLNQDGYIDLIFNNSHDNYTGLPATLATVAPDGKMRCAPLEVQGSQQVAFADLNKDGCLDAVFCPNYDGISPRRLLTIIWGDKDGWPAYRSNASLPAYDARHIAIADLNRDNRPDIVVLNKRAWLPGQPSGNIIRIYWGSKTGFFLPRRLDLGVEGAIDIGAGDFNNDGADDLAVLTIDGKIELLWATHFEQSSTRIKRTHVPLAGRGATCLAVGDATNDGHLDLVVGTDRMDIHVLPGSAREAWGKQITIRATNALHIAIGDLDGDRYADLILAYVEPQVLGGGELVAAGDNSADFVHVLWGNQSGFSTDNAIQMPIKYAAATAVGDLNDDNKPDLAVAVYQGTENFTSNSLVFLGTGNREFKLTKGELPTTAPVHVSIAPAEGELPARAVFCNSFGGTLRQEVSSYIYWNGPQGFNEKNVCVIPKVSAYESTAADLNCDGYVDLIAPYFGELGEVGKYSPYLGANIFWGSKDGFDVQNRRTVLREGCLTTSNVADLDRDGYLDLVLGQNNMDEPAESEQLIIYYGCRNGFDRKHRVAIPTPGGSVNAKIADFNRDGWLDIVVNSQRSDRVRILWGNEEGFDAKRQTLLPTYHPADLETADLNGDGYLDLIVTNNSDRFTARCDLGTTVFWGSKKGFKSSNSQSLPGYLALGPCVADFDGDGYLDVFLPHYHNGIARGTLPAHLWWGGPKGLLPKHRTVLICDSGADALAADFDRDGKLDLAVVCHRGDTDHKTRAIVFYNDGNRFTNPKTVALPVTGPHWMWGEDMGHVHHRKWEQLYESSVHPLARSARNGEVSYKADSPEGTTLTFAIRSAAEQSRLPRQPWREVRSGLFSLDPNDRFLQYRVVFKSDNGDRYPVLDRVEIKLK